MDLRQRVTEAETQLAKALQRLSQLRRASLAGDYDPDVFDRAVQEYRVAAAAVAHARERWLQERTATPSPEEPSPARGALGSLQRRDDHGERPEATASPLADPPAGESAPPPLQVTPYLRFAKYLDQRGLITDWPT